MTKVLNVGRFAIFSILIVALSFAFAPKTNASEDSYAVKLENIVAQAKSLGIKTGSDLIQDAVVHNEFGDFFKNADEKTAGFASDVLILTKNAEVIRSQSDLENYVNNSNRTDYIGVLWYGENAQLAAVWDGIDTPDILTELFGLNSGSDFPQDVLSKIDPGVVNDPDGDCGGTTYVCFRHDDGGNTGFHAVASYLGKWDHVNTAIVGVDYGALVVTSSGQNISLGKGTVNRFSPSASFETVSIS